MPVTEVSADRGSEEFAGVQGFAQSINPEMIVASVGNPQVGQLEAAKDLLNQIPELLQDADVFVRSRLKELMDQVMKITESVRLPLLELALPALRQLNETEYQRLMTNLASIRQVSQPVSLGDWALVYYLQRS
ncbi:MAG: hypothetical protein ACI805_002086, partial [Candidatus Azotimanducaceae bacterium]